MTQINDKKGGQLWQKPIHTHMPWQ